MPEQNEILSREVRINVKDIFHYLLSKWWVFLILGIAGAAVALGYTLLLRPKYTATLTFVLSTETKTSSLAGLASQFGLDLSGGSNDVFSGDNILTLFNSEKMIRQVLFKKPPSSNETLINLLAREWKWDQKWKKKEHTKNSFPFPDNIETVSPIQDSLIREIHIKLIKNSLSVSRVDRKLSVYMLSTTSTNPVFACYLTKFLMDETAKFYIETKTSISKRNLAMLQREADSLRRILGGSIISTASEVDRTFNLNPALQVQRSSVQRGQINTTVLGTAYGEVVKNLEIAKISLQKETPLYQIIDIPRLPLKAKTTSKVFVIGVGIIFMWILTFLFLVFKKALSSSRSV